jgi:hypothetical protein
MNSGLDHARRRLPVQFDGGGRGRRDGVFGRCYSRGGGTCEVDPDVVLVQPAGRQ